MGKRNKGRIRREGQKEKAGVEEPQYFIRNPVSSPCIMRLPRVPHP
jgi:hypothetical protein